MALEVIPSTTTLSAGESQRFEARQGGAAASGIAWSIAPGHKGKIDSSTGVYSSPPMPMFLSKDVTVIARNNSARGEFGAATVHLSAAHSWIVIIAAYIAVSAALLSYWGFQTWTVAFPPDASRIQQADGDQGQAAAGEQSAQDQNPPQSQRPEANAPSTSPAGQDETVENGAAGSSNTPAPDGQSIPPREQPDPAPDAGSSPAAAPASPSGPNPAGGGSSGGQSGGKKSTKLGQDRVLGLLQLVMIFGAGGALVHAVRSLYGYVGNKQFEPSWAPFYFARPFEGAVLALLMIFLFEGSLVRDPPTNINLENGWAACALAGLVGLFADKALLKLEQIFDAVLAPPADTRTGKLASGAALAPVLANLTPDNAAAGSPAAVVQIAGDRFESDAEALVNGAPRVTTFRSPKSLSFTLTNADLSKQTTLKISVKSKAATSNVLDFTVNP